MYGAIIGDIIGSTYEFRGIKTKRFLLFPWCSAFTDDSIMTVAVARALMEWQEQGGDLHDAMVSHMRKLGWEYPNPVGSYGTHFKRWLTSWDPQPYKSCGNGSAMRVSPCGLWATSLEEALALAKISAEVTHNSYEGIKGAKAVAAAIYLAKTGHSKEDIRCYINKKFYRLDKTLSEIRPSYRFDGTCQGSVPQSIIAFLESESYEDAIRNVISLGGDADTMAAITGSIAWSYYWFQNGRSITRAMSNLSKKADRRMPHEFKMTILTFTERCAEREYNRKRNSRCLFDWENPVEKAEQTEHEEIISMPPLILPDR
jgi:ADP-ribosylglycohydrolase